MSFTVTKKSSPKMDTAKLFVFLSLMTLAKCAQNDSQNVLTIQQTQPILSKHSKSVENSQNVKKQSNDMEEFGNVFLEYAKDVINRETINIVPGVYIQRKSPNNVDANSQGKSIDNSFIASLRKFTETHVLRVDLARATTATGRLFFFKGKVWLKKAES
jgi:hypothetical protein